MGNFRVVATVQSLYCPVPNGDPVVNRNRRPTSSGWAILALCAASLALGACGRKGPLDLPPNAASPAMASANSAAPAPTDTQSEAMSKPSVFNPSYGMDAPPAAPRGAKRPFILDPLLDSDPPRN
jgi:predicted small lipoprotein YifL